jgi:uncharacterized glyoxalase superfamily protein PhnB
MSPSSPNAVPNIFPTLRYANAPAAIDWLKRAFGFERQFVVPGPDNTIAHAQLKLGPGVIMLGSAENDALGPRTPRELGGVTQAAYIYVADVDTHYKRAKEAGAEMVRELEDTPYGSREYSARDPEGHIWYFGTYLPEDMPTDTGTPCS